MVYAAQGAKQDLRDHSGRKDSVKKGLVRQKVVYSPRAVLIHGTVPRALVLSSDRAESGKPMLTKGHPEPGVIARLLFVPRAVNGPRLRGSYSGTSMNANWVPPLAGGSSHMHVKGGREVAGVTVISDPRGSVHACDLSPDGAIDQDWHQWR